MLEAHTSELPNGPRERVATALKQVVTSAWELDTYAGDLGEKAKIDQAYARLAKAISNVKAEYASTLLPSPGGAGLGTPTGRVRLFLEMCVVTNGRRR